VDGVHHDKVQKEFSSATMIIYLNDVDEGGGTVWPCLSNLRAPRPQTSTHCEDAFSAGGRWFDGAQAVVRGHYQKHRVAGALHEHLRTLLLATHAGCMRMPPSWVTRAAVRTTPRKGRAVVFFHHRADLSPEPLTWHAGCLPLSGDKWTLQKFKELPRKYRREALRGEEL
jgi:hypothetical protein